MLTAILPIRLPSPFWSSATGLDCLDRFLGMIAGMDEIERVVVVGEGDGVAAVAREYDMEIANIPVPGKIDLPFTHDETMELVRRVEVAYPIRHESLMVIDLRNLLLNVHDLRQAIDLHRKHQDAMVISVSPCRDHPCQYRAYFNFLGCEIIRFSGDAVNQGSEAGRGFEKLVLVKCGEGGEIAVRVHRDEGEIRVSFSLPEEFSQGIVAQVLPFTAQGAVYDDQLELFVDGLGCETQLKTQGQGSLAGVVVTLLHPARSGGYDAVEHFTPRNATWELGGSGFAVEKDGFAPILGRQQFVPVYGYDGSVCILHAHQAGKGAMGRTVPYVLQEVVFVADWVDYLGRLKDNKED
jgi:hypothetical protein